MGLAVVTYLQVEDMEDFPGDSKVPIPKTNETFYHLRHAHLS